MRRTLSLAAGVALTVLVLLAPAAPAVAAEPTAQGTVLAFALTSPNTAVAPVGGMMAAPGDWIQVTGGGRFSPATRAVWAGGAFVHYTVDGTVACRGMWTASRLTGWLDFGTAPAGEHGGVVPCLSATTARRWAGFTPTFR